MPSLKGLGFFYHAYPSVETLGWVMPCLRHWVSFLPPISALQLRSGLAQADVAWVRFLLFDSSKTPAQAKEAWTGHPRRDASSNFRLKGGESRLGRGEGALQGLPDETRVGNASRFRARLQCGQQRPGHAYVDLLVLLLEFKARRLNCDDRRLPHIRKRGECVGHPTGRAREMPPLPGRSSASALSS